MMLQASTSYVPFTGCNSQKTKLLASPEQLENNLLKRQGLGHSCTMPTGSKCKNSMLIIRIVSINSLTLAETALFGGNQSVQFHEGIRPLIFPCGPRGNMITYYQSLFSAKSWKGPHGEVLILPKGEDRGGIMVLGAFIWARAASAMNSPMTSL